MTPTEPAQQSFGEWLRQRRRALDFTQDELARQVGCSPITLRKLEAESRRPSPQIADRLAEVLRVPPADRPAFLRFARGDLFGPPLADSGPADSGPAAPGPAAARRGVSPPANLPAQLTPLIGREALVAEVTRRLRQPALRLLTLTGAGGAGKTRLAEQVAAELLPVFEAGVVFVDLAAVSDPGLVPVAIAEALGIELPGYIRPLERLKHHLRDRQLLLLLDNFEQLLEAVPQLAGLLAACPQLKILVTSRAVLHLAGEQEIEVPPLSVPDLRRLPPVPALTHNPAVALFVQRAQAAVPSFQLTPATAGAVAAICVHLDGLPLAIELAAARSKVLPPADLLERLDHDLSLLAGSGHGRPARQRSLRDTLAWSYQLLAPAEQRLFRRLGVFVGGWTLAAAERVTDAAGDLGLTVVDGLQTLADHSLVRPIAGAEGEPRFAMLETIREYALEQLEASGEAAAVRRSHAAFCLAFAELGAPAHFYENAAPTWRPRMRSEYANLRAGLAWSLGAAEGGQYGLRLAGLMYAMLVNAWPEAQDELERALARPEANRDPETRAGLLCGMGLNLALRGDYPAAQAKLSDSLHIVERLGDRRAHAALDFWLGWLARERGDAPPARARLEACLALYRELGEAANVARCLVTLGQVAVMLEDAAWAAALLDEGLALLQKLGMVEATAWAYNHLGHVAQLRGEFDRARALHEASLPLFRQYGESVGIGEANQSLGATALAQDQWELARDTYGQALWQAQDWDYRYLSAWCLEGLAGVAAGRREWPRAARLWGAAEALRQALGCRPAPASRATRERLMALVNGQLGHGAFAAAWAEGEQLTLEQAVALALA